MPPGEARPLHRLMAEMLRMPDDAAAIFASMAHEEPVFSGLDYDAVGAFGAIPMQPVTEEVR
jgi:hypothetical protein